MVLTFTGSLSIADAGREDVHAMLIGALGCNLAWGIIDGTFYLMACLAERGQKLKTYRAAVETDDSRAAAERLACALPSALVSVLSREELESIHRRLLSSPRPPPRARLDGRDLLGALAVCLLVFASTFPVAMPFLFVDRLAIAMRISNAIAIAMLFITGYLYGGLIGDRPWLVGLAMVLLGACLVALTIALGG